MQHTGVCSLKRISSIDHTGVCLDGVALQAGLHQGHNLSVKLGVRLQVSDVGHKALRPTISLVLPRIVQALELACSASGEALVQHLASDRSRAAATAGTHSVLGNRTCNPTGHRVCGGSQQLAGSGEVLPSSVGQSLELNRVSRVRGVPRYSVVNDILYQLEHSLLLGRALGCQFSPEGVPYIHLHATVREDHVVAVDRILATGLTRSVPQATHTLVGQRL